MSTARRSLPACGHPRRPPCFPPSSVLLRGASAALPHCLLPRLLPPQRGAPPPRALLAPARHAAHGRRGRSPGGRVPRVDPAQHPHAPRLRGLAGEVRPGGGGGCPSGLCAGGEAVWAQTLGAGPARQRAGWGGQQASLALDWAGPSAPRPHGGVVGGGGRRASWGAASRAAPSPLLPSLQPWRVDAGRQRPAAWRRR